MTRRSRRSPHRVVAIASVVATVAPDPGDEILRLEARRRVWECVRRYPGLHLREIARHVRLDPNHAKYHLQTLEKRGLVGSRRDESYVRFFPRESGPVGPRDSIPPHERDLLVLLRRPAPLRVVLLLLDRTQATLTDLARATGLAYSTLHYHLRKMERHGLVDSERTGRDRVYRLRDPAGTTRQLARYRPPDALVSGFLDAWENLEL